MAKIWNEDRNLKDITIKKSERIYGKYIICVGECKLPIFTYSDHFRNNLKKIRENLKFDDEPFASQCIIGYDIYIYI